MHNSDDLSKAGVHRPRCSGIDGNGRVGACSIVLSRGYQDDEDWGDVMYEHSFHYSNLDLIISSVYTGAGGKRQWTDSDQIKDQSWGIHFNKALIVGTSDYPMTASAHPVFCSRHHV